MSESKIAETMEKIDAAFVDVADSIRLPITDTCRYLAEIFEVDLHDLSDQEAK